MGYDHYVGGDSESDEIRQGDGFVVVCGYGRIGRLVCELLGKKFINFVAFDNNPLKAMEARNRWVFFFQVCVCICACVLAVCWLCVMRISSCGCRLRSSCTSSTFLVSLFGET